MIKLAMNTLANMIRPPVIGFSHVGIERVVRRSVIHDWRNIAISLEITGKRFERYRAYNLSSVQMKEHSNQKGGVRRPELPYPIVSLPAG